MTDTPDLARLRSLAGAATQGEWRVASDTQDRRLNAVTDGNRIVIADCWTFSRSEDQCEDNAAYIAAANPATVLALLDRLARLEEWQRDAVAVLRANEWLGRIDDGHGDYRPRCSHCDRARDEGHAPDCEWAALALERPARLEDYAAAPDRLGDYVTDRPGCARRVYLDGRTCDCGLDAALAAANALRPAE